MAIEQGARRHRDRDIGGTGQAVAAPTAEVARQVPTVRVDLRGFDFPLRIRLRNFGEALRVLALEARVAAPRAAAIAALTEHGRWLEEELLPLSTGDFRIGCELFRKKLREGQLDDKEIDIELSPASQSLDFATPPGMEEMTSQLQSMFSNMGKQQKESRRITVKEALKLVHEEEAARMVSDEDLKSRAIEAVEQNGIVFLDEIDKVAKRGESGSGGDVSREGVQRDLLPLIEGSTVSTKHGMVKTDHILFIASGAFHLSKPSDMIPELQGRLPIRVELNALTPEDFKRILTEPSAALIRQYKALLATEGVELSFADDAIERIAQIAYQVNEGTENIGARRLHTVMERLLEEISYEGGDQPGELKVDAAYVDARLGDLARDEDLSRYIL